MIDVSALIEWVEAHQTTVDLLKWIFLIAVAWAVGLFRYVGDLTRKPRIAISEEMSRCLLQERPFQEHADAARAVFLLNIEVANRSSARIVVNAFEIRYQRRIGILKWGKPSSAVSLPNRVHQKMGGGTKIMRNWFAMFPDNMERLTVHGKIDARDAQSGYALFVTHTWGSWNPEVRKGRVRVEVSARLTTGRRVRCKASVPVTDNDELFEKMVPGMREHVEHPTSWNVPARFRRTIDEQSGIVGAGATV